MPRKPKATPKKSTRQDYENEVLNEMRANPIKSQDLTYTIKSKFKNEKQKDLFDKITNKKSRVIFIKGSAGSGKTFISLMAALTCLKDKEYHIGKILISKVIVPAGRDFGFLKGSLEEKTAPYFTSFWSNITKLIGKGWSDTLKGSKIIEEGVVNFMRGDTFGEYTEKNEAIGYVAIMDEAQNTTVSEMKTFISRMGENSKLIILGDSDQVDIQKSLGRNEKNGLDDSFDRFTGIDGIEFIEFNEDDIVRDKFLIEIMKRYKTN